MDTTTVTRYHLDLGQELIAVYLVTALQKQHYQNPAVLYLYLVKKTKGTAILMMNAQEIWYADITTAIIPLLDFHRTGIVALIQRIGIVQCQVNRLKPAVVKLSLAKKTLGIAILTMNALEI